MFLIITRFNKWFHTHLPNAWQCRLHLSEKIVFEIPQMLRFPWIIIAYFWNNRFFIRTSTYAEKLKSLLVNIFHLCWHILRCTVQKACHARYNDARGCHHDWIARNYDGRWPSNMMCHIDDADGSLTHDIQQCDRPPQSFGIFTSSSIQSST